MPHPDPDKVTIVDAEIVGDGAQLPPSTQTTAPGATALAVRLPSFDRSFDTLVRDGDPAAMARHVVADAAFMSLLASDPSFSKHPDLAGAIVGISQGTPAAEVAPFVGRLLDALRSLAQGEAPPAKLELYGFVFAAAAYSGAARTGNAELFRRGSDIIELFDPELSQALQRLCTGKDRDALQGMAGVVDAIKQLSQSAVQAHENGAEYLLLLGSLALRQVASCLRQASEKPALAAAIIARFERELVPEINLARREGIEGTPLLALFNRVPPAAREFFDAARLSLAQVPNVSLAALTHCLAAGAILFPETGLERRGLFRRGQPFVNDLQLTYNALESDAEKVAYLNAMKYGVLPEGPSAQRIVQQAQGLLESEDARIQAGAADVMRVLYLVTLKRAEEAQEAPSEPLLRQVLLALPAELSPEPAEAAAVLSRVRALHQRCLAQGEGTLRAEELALYPEGAEVAASDLQALLTRGLQAVKQGHSALKDDDLAALLARVGPPGFSQAFELLESSLRMPPAQREALVRISAQAATQLHAQAAATGVEFSALADWLQTSFLVGLQRALDAKQQLAARCAAQELALAREYQATQQAILAGKAVMADPEHRAASFLIGNRGFEEQLTRWREVLDRLDATSESVARVRDAAEAAGALRGNAALENRQEMQAFHRRKLAEIEAEEVTAVQRTFGQAKALVEAYDEHKQQLAELQRRAEAYEQREQILGAKAQSAKQSRKGGEEGESVSEARNPLRSELQALAQDLRDLSASTTAVLQQSTVLQSLLLAPLPAATYQRLYTELPVTDLCGELARLRIAQCCGWETTEAEQRVLVHLEALLPNARAANEIVHLTESIAAMCRLERQALRATEPHPLLDRLIGLGFAAVGTAPSEDTAAWSPQASAHVLSTATALYKGAESEAFGASLAAYASTWLHELRTGRAPKYATAIWFVETLQQLSTGACERQELAALGRELAMAMSAQHAAFTTLCKEHTSGLLQATTALARRAQDQHWEQLDGLLPRHLGEARDALQAMSAAQAGPRVPASKALRLEYRPGDAAAGRSCWRLELVLRVYWPGPRQRRQSGVSVVNRRGDDSYWE